MSVAYTAQRPVYLPGENFSQMALPTVELRGSEWVRIHLDVHSPVFFSRNANHRFSPADGKYDVMYAACDFRTAFMEVYGDVILAQRGAMGPCISAKRWLKSVCTEISCESLRLCDFTTDKSRTAMKTDLSSLMHPDLSISHQWADAVMRHPDEVEGILYPSRFTGKPCLALFAGRGNVLANNSVSFPEHEEALMTLNDLVIALA